MVTNSVTEAETGLFTTIDMVSIVVEEQQEALDWYTETLGFEVRDDDPMPGEDGMPAGRWLTIRLPGDSLTVTLEPVEWGLRGREGIDKADLIGTDSLTLHTADLDATVSTLRERGVEIDHGPESVPWGRYVLFGDLYGNTIQVIEPADFGGEEQADADTE
jgi:catechol 2,3-dioxygenase-like lactoylglutathione lyase family enzyme